MCKTQCNKLVFITMFVKKIFQKFHTKFQRKNSKNYSIYLYVKAGSFTIFVKEFIPKKPYKISEKNIMRIIQSICRNSEIFIIYLI